MMARKVARCQAETVEGQGTRGSPSDAAMIKQTSRQITGADPLAAIDSIEYTRRKVVSFLGFNAATAG